MKVVEMRLVLDRGIDDSINTCDRCFDRKLDI